MFYIFTTFKLSGIHKVRNCAFNSRAQSLVPIFYLGGEEIGPVVNQMTHHSAELKAGVCWIKSQSPPCPQSWGGLQKTSALLGL